MLNWQLYEAMLDLKEINGKIFQKKQKNYKTVK